MIALRYILSFFFYSAAGWLIESTYCSIGEKRIINRGFLTGPMCPIYGTGALVMTVFLYNPFKDTPLIVFLLGMFLCDIVEYITSFLMEVLFHARWWDYTYEFLNIKGRICLKHTLFWGVASIAFVYVIHPGVNKVLSSFSDLVVIILVSIILAVFFADVIHAFIKALDIRNLQVKLSGLINVISGGLNNIKSKLETGFEKGSDKVTEIEAEIINTYYELELRFSKREKKSKKNKYSSRFFHNGLNIEKYTRKQIEKLKTLSDDFKANFFENGDKQ